MPNPYSDKGFKFPSDLRNRKFFKDFHAQMSMSDYGRLVVILELLSDFEGNRIGFKSRFSEQVIRIAGFIDESELKSFVDKCCKIGVLETDGLGFWSQMITESMNAFNRKAESARKAANTRWGESRKVKINEDKDVEETPSSLELEDFNIDLEIEIDPIEIEVETEKAPEPVKESATILSNYAVEFESIYNKIRKQHLPNSRHVSLGLNDLAKRRIRDLKGKISLEDLEVIIRNAFLDSFHIENNFRYVTMDYLLRPEIRERYLNLASESKPVQNNLKATVRKEKQRW